MTNSFIHQVAPFLEQIEPLSIQPTNAVANYVKDDGIKAVIFDIYGTLIISASGDIMQSNYDPSMFKKALDSAGFDILIPTSQLMEIHKIFRDEVVNGKENAKKRGIPFPELNIVNIWENTLRQAEEKGFIKGIDKANIKVFTFIFELSSNQVWPMPDMKETIGAIKEMGYPLGIVSNAQFYTPVIMNHFLHNELSEEEYLNGFEKDISVFSYKILKGKPDTAVYEELIEPLAKRGMQAKDVLYVGNDMLKDIYAAQQVGFKTCFFAGDQRAYRLREDHPEASKCTPDYTIIELKQLINILKQ